MADDESITIEALQAENARLRAENARLFGELQASNRQVTQSLEQQTVTAEILRVIAASPHDLGRVLDALVHSICRLTDADGAGLVRVDDNELMWLASTDASFVGKRFPLDGSVS